MDNSTLKNIRERRNIIRFEEASISERKIEAILEAGRWAPSWTNTQPWKFLVIKNPDTKNIISENVPTIFKEGIREAPILIAVVVDATIDPYHYIEDGAVAAQNMALAAKSVGLGSSWIGIYSIKNEKNSSEQKIKKILNLEKNHRIIVIMPVGKPKYFVEKKRKPLSQVMQY